MSEAAQTWAEQSQYDLDTARAMLASGRLPVCPVLLSAGRRESLEGPDCQKNRRIPAAPPQPFASGEIRGNPIGYRPKTISGRVVGLLHPVAVS